MSIISSDQNDPQQKSITISPAIESVDDKVWLEIMAECSENGAAPSVEEIEVACLENGVALSKEELELAVHISRVNEAIFKLFCEGALRLKRIEGKIDVKAAW